MRALFVVLLALAVLPAAAEEPRVYAVMSLIGDALTVLRNEERIGSNLDRSTRTRLELDTSAFDSTTVLAISQEIKRADPQAKPLLLAVRSKELFAAQARVLDEGTGVSRLLETVRPMLGSVKATHLILVTKRRSDAKVQLWDQVVGDGRLEGLGFYVDPSMALRDMKTGDQMTGFVAPYTYFTVSNVDLANGEIIAQHSVMRSQVIASPGATPWNALTGAQKVKMLEEHIRAGVAEAMPKVLPKPN